jgi:hypothetical protein
MRGLTHIRRIPLMWATILLISLSSCGALPPVAIHPSPVIGGATPQSPPAGATPSHSTTTTAIPSQAVPATPCRLPVSGILPGSGGFVEIPGGQFTLDPSSDVAMPGQPDPAGLRRGYTYDPVHSKWLPVPMDWVMPDFSSYAYVSSDTGTQPSVHRVDTVTGQDTVWPHGDQLYAHLVAVRPEGIYGAPGPEILVQVDPTGVQYTVDQGNNGLFEVITASHLFASKWTTSASGAYELGDVYRIDANTGAATLWFSNLSTTNVPIGLDSAGNPIIAGGVQSRRTGQIVASKIWIAGPPSSGAGPQVLYSNDSDPLLIQGPPAVSHGAIWFETDHGLYEYDNLGGFQQVSTTSAYIAGGCL